MPEHLLLESPDDTQYADALVCLPCSAEIVDAALGSMGLDLGLADFYPRRMTL